ncbi:tRNA dimethylallyltransferase [Streptococcus moroccensis]|uniref:tRNA dimethylallyltransferase n=1 Tax=Streptococcus moroccensis TaxID=1451356 RepID=A0ABT9YRG4_9STRE|nr:tRNA (adenosine(37)-N6)-dimethylallyltransferase MiaA [Streptococcus moroccensis]MDQ0222497.1 tRNA dimethylallyltransferase [Streptococcus moroccensis]
MKKKVITVLGPTAVGKTALGIELAQLFNGEIISGDSQQVYKNLDIGTAKATPEEQAAARHHLIDVREVTEGYSAFDFVQEAQLAIEKITGRGKLPIIVGGTGLYLQSLLEGYHLGGQLDQEQVLVYRAELELLSDQELIEQLETAAITLEQFTRRRAIRALELQRFGEELTNTEPPYEVLLIGLSDARDLLYERINQRVDRMVEAGLLEEARWLYDNHPEVQATRGIGYKELFPYFAGEAALDVCLEQLKQNSRRFAKRQLTWFRNRMAVDFYQASEPDTKENILRAVRDFLES